jgi:hypothetical protein
VRTGYLKLIKELQSPTPINEESMQDKLILDQPDTITAKGKVEHVVDNDVPAQKLHEQDKQEATDVLLNEGPVDDGFVIVSK